MSYRNSESDAGRKGGKASSRGKAQAGFQCALPGPKGEWMPAYSGKFGTRNDEGTQEDEVGAGRDGEGSYR